MIDHLLAERHAGAVTPSVADALEAAASWDSSLTVVCGSLLTVGEARSMLLGLPRDPPVAL